MNESGISAHMVAGYDNEPAGAVVYRIAEAGARTWREAKEMYVNGGLVTVNTYPDGTMALFVGCALVWQGQTADMGAERSPAWYDAVRSAATEWGVMETGRDDLFACGQRRKLW
jgi:hypothetical protein